MVSSPGWRVWPGLVAGNGEDLPCDGADPRLFIIEGLATVVVACAAFFILPGESRRLRTDACMADLSDYPSTTRWLTEDERRLAVDRLVVASLETGGAEEADISHMQAFKLAVKNPRTWVSHQRVSQR